mmetsp:Transcript_3210/g.9989  ORF Transcript_3210/g.9989 Transcript_3210/m.9989 type:complete len:339 (-) Transcript_3210:725-1741(-)
MTHWLLRLLPPQCRRHTTCSSPCPPPVWTLALAALERPADGWRSGARCCRRDACLPLRSARESDVGCRRTVCTCVRVCALAACCCCCCSLVGASASVVSMHANITSANCVLPFAPVRSEPARVAVRLQEARRGRLAARGGSGCAGLLRLLAVAGTAEAGGEACTTAGQPQVAPAPPSPLPPRDSPGLLQRDLPGHRLHRLDEHAHLVRVVSGVQTMTEVANVALHASKRLQHRPHATADALVRVIQGARVQVALERLGMAHSLARKGRVHSPIQSNHIVLRLPQRADGPVRASREHRHGHLRHPLLDAGGDADQVGADELVEEVGRGLASPRLKDLQH